MFCLFLLLLGHSLSIVRNLMSSGEPKMKIVYCGPPGAGKRANLKYVFEKFQPNSRQSTHELEPGDEVTVVDFAVPGEVSAHVMLYACPNDASHESLKEVLAGADGVVFVVDSQVDRVEESIDALSVLRVVLAEVGLELDVLPFVIQFNKRDLPNAALVDQLQPVLNPRGVPSFEAVAANGVGVFTCLNEVVSAIRAVRHLTEFERLVAERGETNVEPVRTLSTRSHWRSVLVWRGEDSEVDLLVPTDHEIPDESAFREAVETVGPSGPFAAVSGIDFEAEPARVSYRVELPGRTLQELKNLVGRLKEREVFAIGLQLAAALAPLSDAGLELGHFTADTIWVGNSGKVTLLFAGTAQVAELIGRGSKHQSRAATDWSKDHARCERNGAAPETFFFPPTPRADVFRLGVVLHDCLSGAYLLHRDDAFSEGVALRNPEVPAVSSSCDDLLLAMLRHSPEERPTVAEVTSRLAVLLANDPRAAVRAIIERLP